MLHAWLQVYEAVQELRSSGTWEVASIKQLAPVFEARLASGQPHNLPSLVIPMTVPGVPEDMPSMEVTLSFFHRLRPYVIIHRAKEASKLV